MAKPTVPITLQIGTITADVGTVELPISTGPATRADGVWHLPLTVDHDEFRRRVADLLRGVADEFEKGPTTDG